MAASSSTTARRLVAAAAALAPAAAAGAAPPTKPRLTLLDFALDRAEIDASPPEFRLAPPVPWAGDAKALTCAKILADVAGYEPDAADSVYTHLLGKKYAMATMPNGDGDGGLCTRPYLLCVLDEKTGACCPSLVAVFGEPAYVASAELDVELGIEHFDVVRGGVQSVRGPALPVYVVLSKASRVPWDDAVHPRLVTEARERFEAAVEAGTWVPVEPSPLAAGAAADEDEGDDDAAEGEGACSSCGDSKCRFECDLHCDDLLCKACFVKQHSDCVKVSQKHDHKRALAKAEYKPKRAAPAGEDDDAPPKEKKQKPAAGKSPKKSPRQAVADKDSCAECEDEYATRICDEHQIAVCDECYVTKHDDGDCGPSEDDDDDDAPAPAPKVVCEQCGSASGFVAPCVCGVAHCGFCARYHAPCRGEEITH